MPMGHAPEVTCLATYARQGAHRAGRRQLTRSGPAGFSSKHPITSNDGRPPPVGRYGWPDDRLSCCEIGRYAVSLAWHCTLIAACWSSTSDIHCPPRSLHQWLTASEPVELGVASRHRAVATDEDYSVPAMGWPHISATPALRGSAAPSYHGRLPGDSRAHSCPSTVWGHVRLRPVRAPSHPRIRWRTLPCLPDTVAV